MSDEKRILMLRLLVGVQGAMLAAIGFLDADGIIGFASGFGLVMALLALFEPALARMRASFDASVNKVDPKR